MGRVYPCFRVLAVALLLAVAICSYTALCDEIPFRSPSWSTPDEVIDLAVSADGSIIAVATAVTELGTITEGWLKVYSASGNLLWWWGGEDITVTAVDVSDDGNVVVAAIENKTQLAVFYQLLFWKNAKTLSGTPQPNWSSDEPIGWIGAEALAVSSDGNQVVVVGTGPNVYYWNNTLTLSGGNINPTWQFLLKNELEYVDISDDGDVVAVLGWNITGTYPNYYVFAYKNCRSRTGFDNPPDLEYYCGSSPFPGSIALSDDGMYLVAGVAGNVYFFNTTELEPWDYQWKCSLPAPLVSTAVDISDNGSTVVAVVNIIQASPLMLAIFHNAQLKTGIVTHPDVSFNGASDYTEKDYEDVAVDGLGSIAVGGTGDYVFAVNASTGEPLWYYNGIYPLVSRFVKVSEDGSAVVTAGRIMDSLYYFKLVAPPVGGLISPRIPTIVNVVALTVLLITVVGMLIITVKGKLR